MLGPVVRKGDVVTDFELPRVARFGSANEHADWETAHHVFTYANAVHGMLARMAMAEETGRADAVRGILHGAMALYLARYLNVPPARIPGDGDDRLADLPSDAEGLCAALLDAFDRQRQVDFAARLVARYLTLGHPPQALIATLALALLREDASSTAIKCWRPACANSRLGAGASKADTSSSRSRAISLPIRRPSARRCRPPRSPGGSCAVVKLHQDVGAS
jgi:hypothetical protein